MYRPWRQTQADQARWTEDQPRNNNNNERGWKIRSVFKKGWSREHCFNSLMEGTRILGRKSFLSRSFTPTYVSGCTNVSNFRELIAILENCRWLIAYNVLWLTLYFWNWDKFRHNTLQFFGLLVSFEWKRLHEAWYASMIWELILFFLSENWKRNGIY